MYHHDSRPYEAAASEAAAFARAKFQRLIDDGAVRLSGLMESIAKQKPMDMVVASEALRFGVEPNGLMLNVRDAQDFDVHRFALGQASERIGAPTGYIRTLAEAEETWRHELAEHVLNEHLKHAKKERFLLRSVDGEVRGFLSDKYRRLDVFPIMETFLGGVVRHGAVPHDALVSDTKIRARVVLPTLFEPAKNEVMLYGLELGNSDFGDGKLLLRSFVNRMWCTNLATMDDFLSQVHLGRQLGDHIEFSQETYRLDTETTVSAVRDLIDATVSPKSIEVTMGRIAKAAEVNPEAWKTTRGSIAKLLTKDELKQADDLYANSKDIEVLPEVPSAWRASNVLSWLAKSVQDPDKKMLLQEKAGALIGAKAVA